jgi:hypothetical protein
MPKESVTTEPVVMAGMSRAVDLLTDPAAPLCYPLETWAALFWNTLKRLRRVDLTPSGLWDALTTLDDLATRCPYPAIADRADAALRDTFGEAPCR